MGAAGGDDGVVGAVGDAPAAGRASGVLNCAHARRASASAAGQSPRSCKASAWCTMHWPRNATNSG